MVGKKVICLTCARAIKKNVQTSLGRRGISNEGYEIACCVCGEAVPSYYVGFLERYQKLMRRIDQMHQVLGRPADTPQLTACQEDDLATAASVIVEAIEMDDKAWSATYQLFSLIGLPQRAVEPCAAILYGREQGGAESIGRVIQQTADNEAVMGTAGVVQAIEDARASWDAAATAVALADREESQLQEPLIQQHIVNIT
ncbi:hypothetical protein GGI35DRAFT_463169 [Trichoderma velutinum]